MKFSLELNEQIFEGTEKSTRENIVANIEIFLVGTDHI